MINNNATNSCNTYDEENRESAQEKKAPACQPWNFNSDLSIVGRFNHETVFLKISKQYAFRCK